MMTRAIGVTLDMVVGAIARSHQEYLQRLIGPVSMNALILGLINTGAMWRKTPRRSVVLPAMTVDVKPIQ